MQYRPAILLLLFVSIMCHVAQAQKEPLLRDVYLMRNGDTLEFGNGQVRVVLHAASGHLLRLQLQSGIAFAQTASVPAANVFIEGHPLFQNPMPAGATYAHRVRAGRVSLEVTQAVPDRAARLVTSYILHPGRNLVERVVRVASESDTAQQVHGFLLSLPHVAIGNSSDCEVAVPGPFWPATFTPAGLPLDSLKNKTVRYHAAPDGGFGLFSITNKKSRTTITAFLKTNGDANYHTVAKGDGAGITLEQRSNRAGYLKRGETMASDTQQIWITNTFDEAVALYRAQTSKAMPLAPTPAWVRDAVILEVLPDYFKGGFKELAAKLPFYKGIGFNTLYLMPHWRGGYSPVDLYHVDEKYGTSEDLRRLVQTAHRLGMRVLFDMVIHGFNTASPVVRQHPQFFYRDRNDTLMIHPAWGSVMTDFSNDAYRQYMKDYVLHEQRTYGMDGYRVDAASYKGPNWNTLLPYPAYRSGAAAPELMRIMLSALRKTNKNATLLSEVFGPVFYTVSNFGHDNQTEALSFLIKEMEAGRYHLAQYKKHLQYVYGCLPEGAVRVFYTRNHDTSWFYEFNGYTPLFLTLEAVHAFFGVPEVFAGDPNYKFNPDDDGATYGYYKKLFAARQRYAEFTQGKKLFDAVSADDADVFTGLADDGTRRSVFVASGSSFPKTVSVTLDARYAGGAPVATDALEQTNVPVEKTKTGFTMQLQPYQVVVVRLQ